MHKKAWALIGGGVTIGALLTGCGGVHPSSTDPNLNGVAPVSTGTTPDPGLSPTTDSALRLGKQDLKLSLVVKSKKCYGSAGCSIEADVKVDMTEAGLIVLKRGEHSYDVTYKISRLEDGDQVGTVTLESDGTYQTSSEFMSTTSKNVTPKIDVVSVTRNGI